MLETINSLSNLTGGLRAHRLFARPSGRSFMVAVDRPLIAGVEPGGPSSRELVARAMSARPDAILLAGGSLRQTWDLFGHRGAPSPVVRLDHVLVGPLTRGTGEHHRMLVSVEDAVALGADAVVVFLVGGFASGATFADNVAAVSRTVAEACRWRMPVIVEAVLWGGEAEDERDPAKLAALCRIAAELGADLVKTQHTGDIESMRGVVDACPVPVLVLGGPHTDSREALVGHVETALAAGAGGIVFGRNVYLQEDPEIVAAIRAAVHGEQVDGPDAELEPPPTV